MGSPHSPLGVRRTSSLMYDGPRRYEERTTWGDKRCLHEYEGNEYERRGKHTSTLSDFGEDRRRKFRS